MKTVFKIFLSFLFILFVPFSAYSCGANLENDVLLVSADTPDSTDFKIYSKSAIVFERNSKTVLYEKNSYEKLPMASTTKIMTAILIIENCDLSSNVSVSRTASSVIGSKLGLSTNDIISVQDLLYGLMLCSGNDAAICLAETCSGSIESFAELMNEKAMLLGLSSTHFVTPHGLDDDNHFTTAYDFAKLTDYALDNPLFKQIVGTKSYTIKINDKEQQIHNTNELLDSVSSVYGVKTRLH